MNRIAIFLFACLALGSRAAADDASSVEPAVLSAVRSGLKFVVIPAGTYKFKPGCHVSLSGVKDFEVKAEGVSFVFDRLGPGIVFDHCKNITLSGLTLLRDPVPFSQGTIIAVDRDARSVDVKIAKGYPADVTDSRYFPKMWLNVYDARTRRWQADVSGSSREVERLGPDSFRFFAASGLHEAAVGAAVAWRGAGNEDIGIHSCEGMRIVNVTIKSGNGFCVHEQGGEGGNSYSYTVTWGPTPDGATERPLLASNADAFHSSEVRHVPTLENCHFEGMDDDGIPIHGQYALTVKAEGDQVVVGVRGSPFCQPGDRLRFLNERGVTAGEAKVLSVESVSPPPDVTPPGDLRLFGDLSLVKYEKLTLDRSPETGAGCLVSNASASGSSFVVRNCTIRNNRARGMLIKASDGLIEDCIVEGSSMGGIVICPEMSNWNESDFARNIIVRNNVIRDCDYWTNPGSNQAGALTIAAYEHGGFVPLPGGHRDILVEDNIFENNDGANIVVSSAQGVVIQGNRFLRPMTSPNERGSAIGVGPGALIWLTECSGVVIADNHVYDPGPGLKHVVVATPGVLGSGFQDGVRINNTAAHK